MHVGVGAHPLQHAAVLVPDGRRVRMKPAVDAVGPLETQFSIQRMNMRYGIVPLLGNSRTVFGVDVLETSGPERLACGPSRICCPLRTQIVAGAVRETGPDRQRQRLDPFAKPAFTGGQCLMNLLALCQFLL